MPLEWMVVLTIWIQDPVNGLTRYTVETHTPGTIELSDCHQQIREVASRHINLDSGFIYAEAECKTANAEGEIAI